MASFSIYVIYKAKSLHWTLFSVECDVISLSYSLMILKSHFIKCCISPTIEIYANSSSFSLHISEADWTLIITIILCFGDSLFIRKYIFYIDLKDCLMCDFIHEKVT